jgi:hypothetical protein
MLNAMTRDEPTHGTVFIAWYHDHYTGYWDSLPDGAPRALEQMPECTTTMDAIAWATARTSRVLIRPSSDPAHYYWAGSGEPPDDVALPIYDAPS